MTKTKSEFDDLSADELREQLIALREENIELALHFLNVVRQLRTPLSFIQGYGKLLLSDEDDFAPLNEKQTEAVEAMTNSAIRGNDLVHEIMKIVARAQSYENYGSSLVSYYQLQINKLKRELENAKLKDETIENTIIDFSHEMYQPLSTILAYLNLYQMKALTDSDALAELVKVFDEKANQSLAAFNIFRSRTATVNALFEEADPQSIHLAELINLSEYDVKFDIDKLPPLNLPETFHLVFLLLRYELTGFPAEKISLLAEVQMNRVQVTISSRFYSSMFANFVDFETNKVSCSVPSGFCIANDFVRKVGGEIFMEASAENGTTVTLNLPIYREEST